MLRLIEKTATASPTTSLTLPWEKRIKSRLRVHLDDGREAGIFLPRGEFLRGGDFLLSEEREAIVIKAAEEPLSTLVTDDPLLLAQLCYHLGNRHVALEIHPGRASYLQDHVLDDMVVGLGGKILHELAPFEPEHGAYSGSEHSHG